MPIALLKNEPYALRAVHFQQSMVIRPCFVLKQSRLEDGGFGPNEWILKRKSALENKVASYGDQCDAYKGSGDY